MRLPGRLKSTTVGDLLGTLHREHGSGTLELVEASGRTHRVHLARGLVTAVDLDRASPSLAEMLRREDAVDEETLRRSLLRALASQKLHGTVLVDEFRVSPSVVDLALRRQIQTRLAALENLQDAQILFRVAVRPPRGALFEQPLRAVEFLHGRRRARDREVWSGSARPEPYVAGAREDAARAHARRLLGLSGTEDEAAIKRAFRKLARELHPDTHPTATDEERRELSARFSEVNAAYQSLLALVA
jgi:hypothetical protein